MTDRLTKIRKEVFQLLLQEKDRSEITAQFDWAGEEKNIKITFKHILPISKNIKEEKILVRIPPNYPKEPPTLDFIENTEGIAPIFLMSDYLIK